MNNPTKMDQDLENAVQNATMMKDFIFMHKNQDFLKFCFDYEFPDEAFYTGGKRIVTLDVFLEKYIFFCF